MLLLFLVNSGSAETFVPYTPDSLKKGDWVEIESVHYYPYIAPGIEEKVPWHREKTSRGAQRPQLWTTGNRSVAEKWHVYCH